ncbi:MAG: rhodanese-like domain-containing protein, partial [Rhodospirillales bacterium]|nr:rhodanese-like domain-containing protein [Rhodospirillales bacterium]
MAAAQNGVRYPEYLVETDWLEQHLSDPDLRVFDCTIVAGPNPDPVQGKKFPFVFENGRSHFGEAHIPGAGFIDLLADLSDKSSKLPLMVPSEQQFVDAMSQYGVGDGTRVVLYSTSEPMWAARVWWMLRSFGFDNAAILNGGWAKWTAEGRPVSSEPFTYSPVRFTARFRPGTFVGKDDVLAAIGDNSVCTINALPPAMHAGTGGPVFGRKGRIAGSVNVPSGSLHDPETGTYLPADQLPKIFDGVRTGEADKIIAY